MRECVELYLHSRMHGITFPLTTTTVIVIKIMYSAGNEFPQQHKICRSTEKYLHQREMRFLRAASGYRMMNHKCNEDIRK